MTWKLHSKRNLALHDARERAGQPVPRERSAESVWGPPAAPLGQPAVPRESRPREALRTDLFARRSETCPPWARPAQPIYRAPAAAPRAEPRDSRQASPAEDSASIAPLRPHTPTQPHPHVSPQNRENSLRALGCRGDPTKQRCPQPIRPAREVPSIRAQRPSVVHEPPANA